MLPFVMELLAPATPTEAGALAVSFRDEAGDEVGLVLRGRLDGDGRLVGFERPELQRVVPHAYTSKIDGEQLEYRTREDTPLSWEDAAELLERLAPLLAADATLAAHHRAVFNAIAARGAVAPLSPQTPVR